MPTPLCRVAIPCMSLLAGLATLAVAGAEPSVAPGQPSRPVGPGTPPAPPSPAPAPSSVQPPSGQPSAAQPALASEPTRKPSAPGSIYAGEAALLAKGFAFTEGPLYIATGRLANHWVFSDIPNGTIHSLTFGNDLAKATDLAKPALFLAKTRRANGLAMAADGRLICAESDGSVGAWEPLALPAESSSIIPTRTALVETFASKRFNSPNDLCIGKSGDVYFTDPGYFAPTGVPRPQPCEGVYRIAPVKVGDSTSTAQSGEAIATLISDEYKRPNGICLSPDGKLLYVGDAGTGEVYFHAVSDDGSVGKDRTKLGDIKGVKAAGRGGVDGLKCDSAGNVHVTGPGGIWCFSPKGEWLDRVELPYASNFAFGGPDGKDILITSGKEIWRARLK